MEKSTVRTLRAGQDGMGRTGSRATGAGSAARTGATSTGMPFSTALPDSGSIRVSSASRLLFAPACSAATPSCMPGSSWPQPCGMLTTPGITASVTSTVTSIEPVLGGDPRGRRPRARAIGVVGMDVQRAAFLAAHQVGTLCIQELLERSWRRPISTMPPLRWRASEASSRRRRPRSARARARSCRSRCADPPACAARVGRGRCRGARLELAERQALGLGAEAVAVGPDASIKSSPARARARLERGHISSALRPASGEAGPFSSRSTSSAHEVVERLDVGIGSLAGGDAGEAQERLPLGQAPRVRPQHRRRVVGHVADGELVEREVVVGPAERRGSRQDHVGVAGGLVDVDVDADHQLELSSARRRRPALGVLTTGFPAIVNRART